MKELGKGEGRGMHGLSLYDILREGRVLPFDKFAITLRDAARCARVSS
jgi:hypothetical protein